MNVESIGVTDSATISSINLFNGDYTFEVEGSDVDNNGIAGSPKMTGLLEDLNGLSR